MAETPKHIFVGRLKRDYFITATDKPVLDTLGGNLPYAAVGLKIWEESPPPLHAYAHSSRRYPSRKNQYIMLC